MFTNYYKALNQTPIDINNQKLSQQALIKRRTRNPFSKEEDQQILQLVQYFGVNDKNNWYFIASQLKGRSPRQCRERYQLFLSDQVRKNAKWSSEEDEILLSKYQIYGPHWKQLEQFFVGRTSYNIKNRFISLSRRMKPSEDKEDYQRCELKEEVILTKSNPKEPELPDKTDCIFNNDYSSVLNESDFEFDLDNFPLIIDGNEQYNIFD
ncbi:hypothetical protein M9Y10_030971 [Tritrichomonas musculus]|uniref:Myb-like DNA-binding domain containing protein n=1 Tax=Tritrichomonas musculus TaxID=1915356 RepID=A0ABR2H1G1_9EUKA